MSGRYAEGTTVPPEKSRMEIETILRRYGASEFASGWDTTRVALMFTAHDRRVRFDVPMPSIDEIPNVDGAGGAHSRWRSRRSSKLALGVGRVTALRTRWAAHTRDRASMRRFSRGLSMLAQASRRSR